MKLFLQKNAKFSSAGAPPPDPRASGGWGFAPKPPAAGIWGLRPQTPQTAPPLRISGYAPGYIPLNNLTVYPQQFEYGLHLHPLQ